MTERDLEVLTLVARGFSNDQIADTLYLSRQTIASRISAMLRTICGANRAELVARAYAGGLLTAGTWPPEATGKRVMLR